METMPYLDDDDALEDEVAKLLQDVDESEMPHVELDPDEEDFDYKKYVTDKSLLEESPYLNALFKGSKLEVMNKKMIFKKYKAYGPGGLIEVFLQPRFVRAILLWANQSLHRKGKLEISCHELKSFISLEIAMSIVRINKIKDYWSNKVFLGNSDFKNIMSRDKFCYIRSNIMFHPPFMNEFDSESKNQDPLWNCRHLMQHFQQTFADVAVPMGCSALDEMGSKSKGRSKAISYSPNKPDKYAIRFYSVVGHAWKYTFLL